MSKPASLRRRIALALIFIFAALVAYAVWPRTASLRDFDPDAVAAYDARMWENYYAKRRLALLRDLYRTARTQLGASPFRALQIGWHAADAARRFQPSRSREEAQTALPALRAYYATVRKISGEAFDSDEAARLELEWWQLRREHATPEVYGETLARCLAVFYRLDNTDLREAARIRAEMMAYRDARRGAMRETDWRHVEERLREAYRLLSRALAENKPR